MAKSGNGYQGNLPPITTGYPIIQGPIQEKRSSKPTYAGVLLVVAGLLGLVTAGGMIFISTLDFDRLYEDSGALSGEGKVSGLIVYEENKTGAEGVKVTLDSQNFSIITRASGEFIFTFVETGRHTLIVEKEGYNSIYHDFYINGPDDSVEIDLELEEGNGTTLEQDVKNPLDNFKSVFTTCGALIVVFSIFTLLGAVASFQRKNYWLAKLGAVFGIFTVGLLIGSVLSMAALIYLLFSKDSFDLD